MVGEDNWLAIACEEDSQWVSLSRVIGAHHLSSLGVDERRERESEIDELISSWAKNIDGGVAEVELQSLGVLLTEFSLLLKSRWTLNLLTEKLLVKLVIHVTVRCGSKIQLSTCLEPQDMRALQLHQLASIYSKCSQKY